MLVSSLFEKLDPDIVFSGLEDGLAGFGNGTVVAVVIDDQGVVEEEFGAVVGVEVEGIYSCLGQAGGQPRRKKQGQNDREEEASHGAQGNFGVQCAEGRPCTLTPCFEGIIFFLACELLILLTFSTLTH